MKFVSFPLNLLNHRYQRNIMGRHIVLFSLHISGPYELTFQGSWLSIQDYRSSPKNTNNKTVQLCEHSGCKSWTEQELVVKEFGVFWLFVVVFCLCLFLVFFFSEPLSLFHEVSSEERTEILTMQTLKIKTNVPVESHSSHPALYSWWQT